MDQEQERLMAGLGMRQTAVQCGKCGVQLWEHPRQGAQFQVLGPSLYANVCVSCRKVYCPECIQLGGPTPCPECGSPTEPAGVKELTQIGITL